METAIRFIAGAIAFAIGIFVSLFLLHIIRQRRQSKGCRFCVEPPKYLVSDSYRNTIKIGCWIKETNLKIKVFSAKYPVGEGRTQKINYCPMCGRKLK